MHEEAEAVNEEEFRSNMCSHMEKQTDFLCEISEGMRAVRMFGRVVKWIVGTAGSVTGIIGLWNFLTKH